MEILKYLVFILLGITYLTILFFSVKTKRFFKTLLFNSFLGLVSLSIIDLTSKFTGVFIPINWYTVIGGGTLGIPAICGFLAIQFIVI